MKKLLVFLAAISLLIVSCDKVDTSGIEARLDTIEKVSITSLQTQMGQMNTTLGTLQATQTQLSGFVTTLQTSVGTLEGNYSTLNTAVDNLQNQDVQFGKDIEALGKTIEDSESDMKKWVDESYTTLTKFNALQEEVGGIKTNIQNIFSRLDGLDSSTKKIADDLRDLSTDLNERLGKCEQDIEGIKQDLKNLQDDMASVKEQMAAIVSSVQSVVVVPDYSDGSVKMTNAAENPLRFEVYPLEAAANLATLGASALSLDFVETETKAGVLTNIPVTKVSFDGELLSVSANGSALSAEILSGTSCANARLRISDGTVTRSSEYFQLTFAIEPSGDIVIENLPVTNITEINATLNAKISVSKTDNDDIYYGFVYSEQDDNLFCNREFYPIADTLKTRRISQDGVITCTPYKLKSNTKYYYRSFVMKNNVAYYGSISEFNTLDISAEVTTLPATDIELYTATLNGSLSVNSLEILDKEVWFLCSSNPNNSTLEKLQTDGIERWATLQDDGTFHVTLSDIEVLGAIFYFVAVSRVGDKVFYGEVMSFVTWDYTYIAGEAVDLGLSVKWSSWNLGATKPEEYGAYFAWGETSRKTNYTSLTYRWSSNGSDYYFTRYCPSNQSNYWGASGSPDNKTEFKDYDYADDAARAILGDNWRTPTESEWKELIDNCTWVWTDNYNDSGMTGRIVTSNKTGYTNKSIFLPAAGGRLDTRIYDNGTRGRYWSASLNTDDPRYARHVYFNNDNVKSGSIYRILGVSVRPVTE